MLTATVIYLVINIIKGRSPVYIGSDMIVGYIAIFFIWLVEYLKAVVSLHVPDRKDS